MVRPSCRQQDTERKSQRTAEKADETWKRRQHSYDSHNAPTKRHAQTSSTDWTPWRPVLVMVPSALQQSRPSRTLLEPLARGRSQSLAANSKGCKYRRNLPTSHYRLSKNDRNDITSGKFPSFDVSWMIFFLLLPFGHEWWWWEQRGEIACQPGRLMRTGEDQL